MVLPGQAARHRTRPDVNHSVYALQMNRPEITPQQRTLAHATEVAGSIERLADFLCRPFADLVAWGRGVPIPGPAHLALLEIVSAKALTIAALDHLQARGRKPRRGLLADVF
jgi:hypothetical protein